MNKELFEKLIEETKETIKKNSEIRFKEIYLSAMFKELNENATSCAINEILKKRDKILNILYAEQLLDDCGEVIKSNMNDAGVNPGRITTLWNQISLNINTPEFPEFIPHIPAYEPSRSSDNAVNSPTSTDYVLDALFIGIAIAGILAPVPAIPKAVMIAGGAAGAIAQTSKIINKSSKSNNSETTESVIANYRTEIEKNCNKLIKLFNNWIDIIILDANKIVG